MWVLRSHLRTQVIRIGGQNFYPLRHLSVLSRSIAVFRGGAMPRTEPGASYMLGDCSTTEL